MTKEIQIKKYSGQWDVFDVNKLINSLRRSKADEQLVQEIAQEVYKRVKEGMTTKEIYETAFKMLRRKARSSASRYKLKKALMELGPSGYPFERFVGKLLEHEGFSTKIGVIVEGNCISHEVDVIAQKEEKHYLIECKYHSVQGRFCNVKIPLYIHSRFQDVVSQWEKYPGHQQKIHQGGLVTNTRFTSDAITYGNCIGLMIISWDYPNSQSLKLRIDRAGLHPLTSLTALTKAEKSKLLDKGIVLCKEIAEDPNLLDDLRIDKKRQIKILEDCADLCTSYNSDHHEK